MNKKICNCCKKQKALNEYSKNKESKDGLGQWCRECCKKYNKKWYQENKQARKVYGKQWRDENPEYSKEYRNKNIEQCRKNEKEWEEKNKEKRKKYSEKYYVINKEYINKTSKKWRDKNPEYSNENHKKRRKTDIEYVLRTNISTIIWKALKLQRYSKNNQSCLKYVSFNINQLKEHLEKHFDNKMNWNNYGAYWHIDHIIPMSLYDYSNIEEIKKCWSLNNLRPLEKNENYSKGKKLVRNLIEKYNLFSILPKKINGVKSA